MSETNDGSAQAGRTGKTLSLKKTETSTVKQSFSHGRTKAVVVEKKRARVAPGASAAPPPPAAAAEKPKIAVKKPSPAEQPLTTQAASAALRDSQSRAGVVLRQLTDEEKDARSRALADARVAEAEARKRADADARHRAVEEARLAQERAAAEKRKAEEDARKASDEAARRRAEEEASRRLEKKDDGTAKVAERPGDAPRRARTQVEEDEESGSKKPGSKTAPKAPVARKEPDARRRGKLTVTKALTDDDERTRSLAAFRRHLQRVNRAGQQQAPAPAGPRE